MSDANKVLTRRWFEEVWNNHDAAAIDRMFARDGKAHGFPEPNSVLEGPEAFKSIHRYFLGAFPDLHITVNDIITEGDKVAVTWTATMTHLGPDLGFPPTGERVTLEGASFMTAADGQIHDGKNFMEMEALIRRLRQSAEAPPAATAHAG